MQATRLFPLFALLLAGPAWSAPQHLSLRHPNRVSPDWRLVLEGASPYAHAYLYQELAGAEDLPFDPGSRASLLGQYVLDGEGAFEISVPRVDLLADLRVRAWTIPSGATASSGTASNAVTLGASLGVGQPLMRRIFVSEFMKDPTAVSDSAGEWVEIVNPTPLPVDIEGWVLSDLGSQSVVLLNGGQGMVMAPFGFRVLGRSLDATANGGVTVDFTYGNFSLSNGADEIILSDANGLMFDRVVYDDGVTWPDLPGRSVMLLRSRHNAFDNDDGANWCHSVPPLSATNTDTGSPGQLNGPCGP